MIIVVVVAINAVVSVYVQERDSYFCVIEIIDHDRYYIRM